MDGSTTLTQPAEIDKIRKAFSGEDEVPEVLVPCYPLIQATAIGIEEETGDDDDEPVTVAEYRSKLAGLTRVHPGDDAPRHPCHAVAAGREGAQTEDETAHAGAVLARGLPRDDG